MERIEEKTHIEKWKKCSNQLHYVQEEQLFDCHLIEMKDFLKPFDLFENKISIKIEQLNENDHQGFENHFDHPLTNNHLPFSLIRNKNLWSMKRFQFLPFLFFYFGMKMTNNWSKRNSIQWKKWWSKRFVEKWRDSNIMNEKFLRFSLIFRIKIINEEQLIMNNKDEEWKAFQWKIFH